jgi:hypothetical protein
MTIINSSCHHVIPNEVRNPLGLRNPKVSGISPPFGRRNDKPEGVKKHKVWLSSYLE